MANKPAKLSLFCGFWGYVQTKMPLQKFFFFAVVSNLKILLFLWYHIWQFIPNYTYLTYY